MNKTPDDESTGITPLIFNDVDITEKPDVHQALGKRQRMINGAAALLLAGMLTPLAGKVIENNKGEKDIREKTPKPQTLINNEKKEIVSATQSDGGTLIDDDKESERIILEAGTWGDSDTKNESNSNNGISNEDKEDCIGELPVEYKEGSENDATCSIDIKESKPGAEVYKGVPIREINTGKAISCYLTPYGMNGANIKLAGTFQRISQRGSIQLKDGAACIKFKDKTGTIEVNGEVNAIIQSNGTIMTSIKELQTENGNHKFVIIEAEKGDAIIEVTSPSSGAKQQCVVKEKTKKTIPLYSEINRSENEPGISCFVASDHIGNTNLQNNKFMIGIGATLIIMKTFRNFKKRNNQDKKK